jgi:AmmeMemoRadiSam system protein B
MGYQTRRRRSRSATRSPRRSTERRALLVASTDLSHYHDAPPRNSWIPVVIDCVSQLDADRLQPRSTINPATACGGGPTVAVMRAAQQLGARDAVVLDYADSGGRVGRQVQLSWGTSRPAIGRF